MMNDDDDDEAHTTGDDHHMRKKKLLLPSLIAQLLLIGRLILCIMELPPDLYPTPNIGLVHSLKYLSSVIFALLRLSHSLP